MIVSPDAGADGSSGAMEQDIEISADDLKVLIDKYAKSTLQSFQVGAHEPEIMLLRTLTFLSTIPQTQMLQKIKEKEDVISNRLSKLEKSLNVHH